MRSGRIFTNLRRVRLVVGTVLGLLALFGYAREAFAVETVGPWTVLGGFTSSYFGTGPYETVTDGFTVIPGVVVPKAHKGEYTKTHSVVNGDYVDLINSGAGSQSFTAQGGSRTAPSTSTGWYAYGAVLRGTLNCEPIGTSIEADWAFYPLAPQFSPITVGSYHDQFAIDRFSEYWGASKWMRSSGATGSVVESYETERSRMAFLQAVYIVAQRTGSYWTYMGRVIDVPAGTAGMGRIPAYRASFSGTGTVLPSVTPSCAWPTQWQEIDRSGGNSGPLADLELINDFSVYGTHQSLIVETFDASAASALRSNLAAGWEPAQSVLASDAPESILTTDTALPGVGTGLFDWLMSNVNKVLAPWRDQLDQWIWPLIEIGEW